MSKEIELFEDKKIRTAWDPEQEKWYFSVVDVVQVLTDSVDGRKYWNKLKQRLREEGSQLVTNCHQLKMKATDGKNRLTDVADTEQLFRIIQSIPSPKAEPFKLWLARVGSERIEETIDPEQAIDRAFETYLKKGYSKEWIGQRLLNIKIRNNLTDEWDSRGVKKGIEYAILTDEITKAWAGVTTRQYKELKGLKKENLRDNMSDLELVLTMLAEATTTELSKVTNPSTFAENKKIAKDGGTVAGNARKEIEERTGNPVLTDKTATDFTSLISDIITANLSGGKDDEES
ncbi:MAG: Bro-N domain-containing protein [Clostridia bacterium]